MYYVYILHSKKDNKLYTGCTNDLRKRIEMHNSGKYFLLSFIHLGFLFYYEAYRNREDAFQREKYLKTGWGRNYIKRVLKNYFKSYDEKSPANLKILASEKFKKMSILIKNVILNGKRQDVLIERNRIKKIGRKLNFKAKEKIDGKEEKAILPGLINCHCHAAMTLFRGYADDLLLNIWLKEKIWPLEKKLTEDDVYWGTKLACLEMIKTGTTAFNDMYWYEEAAIVAIEEIGIRAVVGLVLLDFLPMGSKEKVEKLYQKLKTNQLKTVKLSIAPHSIYAVSRENLIWAKNFARKHNLLLHIHLSETKKEIKDCLKKYNLRPVEYLEKIGFLNEKVILAHSIWLCDKEIKILAKRKSSISYNPCSNMKLAAGIFPYQKIKKTKVNITLGTDGPASNNNLDLFEEMKFASLLQKIKEKNPTVASSSEIFELATKNGAKALKINSGELKEGKLADLILVDLNQVSLKPGHNLISDLVYSANGNCVSELICDGKILMRERKVKDEEKILKEATKKAKKLTI